MPGAVRLAVDCGSVTTAAVLVWPDGRWQALRFDDRPVLLSAVFVRPSGWMVAGAQAWQCAADAVVGLFVPSPVRHIRDDVISGDGVSAAGVDVVAEPLRRVAEVARQVAGGPVEDVRLVAPAGWGPRRSMLLRQAAHRAGLGAVTVVPAPVAVAGLLEAAGTPVPLGAHVAVCDVGGGVEATVLHRTPAGFEVVSVLSDPDAGGLRLDEWLAASLNGLTPPAAAATPVDPRWWPVLAAARAAKEELATQPAVAVGMPPPHPPVVLTAPVVQVQAHPLWERAAHLTAQAVEVANLRPADLAGVYLCGGGAVMPQAPPTIASVFGGPVQVVPDPANAAARGAASATGPPGAAKDALAAMSWLPELPLRRLLGVLVPAVMSGALLVEFLAVKTRHPADFQAAFPGGYQAQPPNIVLSWGQLGVAGLLALLACLCGAAVLGAVLPANAGVPGPPSSEAVRMGGGLVVAAVLGSFIAALYGVGGAVYLNAPLGAFLRWTLLCTLPLAVIAVCTGLLIAARGRTPVTGWHRWLQFPILSAIPAAGGMLLLAVAYGYLPTDAGPTNTLERVGGLLIGVGAGLALVRPPLYRLVLTPLLAAVTTAIVDFGTTGILAVFYVAAVTCWWLQRLWQLLFDLPGGWPADA